MRAPGGGRTTFIDRVGIQGALLLLAAFLIRCWQFGNPVIQIDDQFYLLVGDRMLHGALPYVDIWDRKPIGLFLIYAAIRLLGGDGVLQYQIVATFFAALTAFAICRISGYISNRSGAVWAGVVYLVAIMSVGGDGGQSPVFYNVFVAGAALLIMRYLASSKSSPTDLLRTGIGAMLLIGVAIQIKYTVLFEGIFFGLALLWIGYRAGLGYVTILLFGAAWVATALIPTAAALGYYAAIDQLNAFLFSNFVSIGDRMPSAASQIADRLGKILLRTYPVVIAAIVSLFVVRRRAERMQLMPPWSFVRAWLGASVAGFLIFGSYYDHYSLPVIVPMAVVSAPLLDDGLSGIQLLKIRGKSWLIPIGGLVSALLFSSGYSVIKDNIRQRGQASKMRLLTRSIQPYLGSGCLYVFDEEPILYYRTNSCFYSRFVFPPHLASYWEQNALGIDTLGEVRRIMARRPPVVVTADRMRVDPNVATWQYMRGELKRNYKLLASVGLKKFSRQVYLRRDIPFRPGDPIPPAAFGDTLPSRAALR